ncbi:MAG: alkaline phosphatase [Chthoniobacterales bacterium]|nr:alkaline phosphatase [Chthoniobacterales bacterium]
MTPRDLIIIAAAAACGLSSACSPSEPGPTKGSAIFFHADGTGVAHWQMARMLLAGPDGDIHWDRLPHTAIYRGHAEDVLTPSSNAGATMHAYGVKAPHEAFGTDSSGRPPLAPSGHRRSILQEARVRGIATGLVNSGHANEPGTAVFAVSAASRDDSEEIVAGLVASGVDVMLAGGEVDFLPEGMTGRHGQPGRRRDGRNLVAEAEAAGYRVVFTRDELAALPDDAGKVLGIFAAHHTFNDRPEQDLEKAGFAPYDPAAPTVAEMTAAALRFLGGRQFLLIVEEEGTDNFSNCNNAVGMLEALRRADEGLGVAFSFVEKHPDTLLLSCADSDAGMPDVVGLRGADYEEKMLRTGRDINGAPIDGAEFTAEGGVAKPFVSAPDRAGRTHEFVVIWGSVLDAGGGIAARAAGLNAGEVRGSFDNTRVYDLLYRTLFGGAPGES